MQITPTKNIYPTKLLLLYIFFSSSGLLNLQAERASHVGSPIKPITLSEKAWKFYLYLHYLELGEGGRGRLAIYYLQIK